MVVVPDVWIHHLQPPTQIPALKQFFRNGKMSALVSRQFPDLALDNSLKHGDEEIKAQPRWFRALRHGGRMLGALVTFRWIYLATSLAYGLGVLAGNMDSGSSVGPAPPARPAPG